MAFKLVRTSSPSRNRGVFPLFLTTLARGLFLFSQASVAQLAAPGPGPDYAGPTENYCKQVEPFPEPVKQLITARILAQRDGKPVPPMPPESGMAYLKWQATSLREDFGGNCYYLAANKALPPSPGHRVVFFGDSLTELWGLEDPSFFTADRINRGISGQTTAQMLVRFRQDVIDLKPETLHLLAGGNDIAGNTGPTSMTRIEEAIETMVELAQEHHIRVVLASMTPAGALSWRMTVKPIPYIQEYNAWLKAYAERKGITYVDYFTPLAAPDRSFPAKWTLDGVHPNLQGYQVMELVALQALQGQK